MGFYSERYPVARMVLVIFEDHAAVDAIKGLNVGHALYRARRNWESALEIHDLGPDDDALPFETAQSIATDLYEFAGRV